MKGTFWSWTFRLGSGGDEAYRGEEAAHTAWVSRQQRQVGDVSVGVDEKIRQWPGFPAAESPILSESLPGLKRSIERQRKMVESRQSMFEFLLSIEFSGKFSEYDRIVTDRPLIGPALNLAARPREPIRVLCENIGNNAGVNRDHVFPRLRRNQSSVWPFIFPPLNNTASTRLPRESLAAFITSTPSGWSTSSILARGSNPCFRRLATGIVIWPLPVTFMSGVFPNCGSKVNLRIRRGRWADGSPSQPRPAAVYLGDNRNLPVVFRKRSH
jgi:hypothetical protein